MSRRARLLLGAALLAAAPALAGCRGEDEPWLSHVKDGKYDESSVPDLSPPQPTTPGAPAPPVAGGLSGGDAPAAVDPDAPPPVTDAEPGGGESKGDDQAADDAGAEDSARTPDSGDADPAGEAPARGSRQERRQAEGGTASEQLNERRRRQAAPPPRTRADRIAADKQAMLDLRTMVSIIEGCNSGRDSYDKCNTHRELGGPEILGLEIGRVNGQIAINATRRGFRVTTTSRSGAKFTMARGPAGDRFRCIPGPQPGACPASRAWGW